MSDYNLIIDTQNRRLVADFFSTEAGTAPDCVFGDKPTVNVQLVKANSNDADQPWQADGDLTGQTIRVGVGSLADDTPSAYIELTDDLAAASAVVTEVRAGVLNTTNEIQRVEILDAVSGNYTLTIAGETTTPLDLDASLDCIKDAVEALASITADSVSISGNPLAYNLEFDSSLADVGAITVNLDNVTSRVGKTGTLDLHVNEILTLLDGETSIDATLEVVRWTTADVAGETVLQVPVTITQDVIPDTVPGTTPLPGYATIDLDHINQSGATTGQVAQWNGTTWVAATVAGTGDLLSTANLSDLADIPTARTNLGLGTAATTNATDYATAAQGTLADSALQSTDIDTLAELNAIVGDATLIETNDSRLSDARTPTAHTHTAADIDAEASADGYVLTSDGAGNAAWEASSGGAGHDPVTVTDSAEIDFTLVGQDITASIVTGSIDETKLDASTNASLDLADSASQPGHTHTASEVTDFDTEVSNNTTVAGNESYTPRVLSGTAKTATFTAVIGETHLINTSGSGFTANLPAIAGGQGRIAFYFTGTGNSLTIDPSGSEQIGGKNTLKLDHGHNTIENDGTEWKLIQRSGVTPNRLDPAQITSNQDGYNPTDWSHGVTHLYIDSDASREIQGFEEDGFHDMEQVIITNDGSNDIVIKHDTATNVANRVLVDGGADFTLGANQTGILMRDGTANKWRFYGVNQDLTSYQLKPAEGAFVDGDKTKLDGIEALADVTDTANVTAAGALMDSEVDADIKTLALPANTTISTFGASLVDDADAATARTTLGVDAAGTDNSVEVISIACSDETTDLTTGTAKATFRMPFAMTLTEVRASVTTAPTGSTLIVDINEGGATIMTTNKLSIDATEKTSETAATAPGITDSALADDAEITVDIDQVGSTVAGAGLKIYLIGTRA